MATIQEELDLAFVEVGTRIKAARALVGDLSSLTTDEKGNVVAAINWLLATVSDALDDVGVLNDASVGNNVTWSANKILSITGQLSNLNTTAKGNIVAAVNEVLGLIGQAGAAIDDATPRTTTVYSSSKTDSQIANAKAALKNEILGGAGAAYDTLQELRDLLTASDADDDAAISAINTALGNRLRFDAAQVLTAAQKAQANANLGSVALADFGDPAHSYKNVLVAALA